MEMKTEKRRTVTPQQVEEIYGIPVGTLCQLRYLKRGPKYFILGNTQGKRHRILYFVESIESCIKGG